MCDFWRGHQPTVAFCDLRDEAAGEYLYAVSNFDTM